MSKLENLPRLTDRIPTTSIASDNQRADAQKEMLSGNGLNAQEAAAQQLMSAVTAT